jgi:hypothetical protein
MPGAADLLATWEAGIAASGAHRTLLLHALARPAEDARALLAMPVGERDADLLALRLALFGSVARVRLACAECAEELEFDFDVQDALRAGADGHRDGAAPIEVTEGRWMVRLRPPTPADLVAAAEAPPDRARAVVLARCVLEARRGGRRASAADLPGAVQDRVAQAAAAHDPRADITFDVPCPECGHRTKALLDPGVFLWSEVDAWARGTMLDVSLLAAAYGWSEPEVLALSPFRRRHYLELSGHA